MLSFAGQVAQNRGAADRAQGAPCVAQTPPLPPSSSIIPGQNTGMGLCGRTQRGRRVCRCWLREPPQSIPPPWDSACLSVNRDSLSTSATGLPWELRRRTRAAPSAHGHVTLPPLRGGTRAQRPGAVLAADAHPREEASRRTQAQSWLQVQTPSGDLGLRAPCCPLWPYGSF